MARQAASHPLAALLLLTAAGAADAQAPREWGPFRGANTHATIVEQDIADFAARGGNLLRFSHSTLPLMDKRSGEYNEGAFRKLDQLLNWCERYGVRAVIDPHTAPGFQDNYTTLPDDAFWKDFRYHEQFIRLWERIASRYKDRGDVVAGYDLLNEPAIPNCGAKNTAADWNLLVSKLVRAIRTVDFRHTIVIEPPRVRCNGARTPGTESLLTYMDAPPDPNVVYSPHLYEPAEFTMQGVSGRPQPVFYPGEIAGQRWDASRLELILEPVAAYQHKHGVPIYVGEFGVVRWTGDAGNQYLRDAIEVFEKNGWSWGYHAWRAGGNQFDAERSNTSEADTARQASTPRLEMLSAYWKRNWIGERAIFSAGAVTNGASFLAGPIAPGEILAIFGERIGPESLHGLRLNAAGRVDTSLGGLTVTFDGVPAPLLYASPGQLGVVAPYFIAQREQVRIRIRGAERVSLPVTLPVAAQATGVFTQNGSGSGAAAAVDASGVLNSPANPAPVGSVVSLFATGEGLLEPVPLDGAVTGGPLPGSSTEIEVLVDGRPAELLYAGPAPGQVAGVLQVNFRIPEGARPGGSIPLTLRCGRVASQAGVTISVAP